MESKERKQAFKKPKQTELKEMFSLDLTQVTSENSKWICFFNGLAVRILANAATNKENVKEEIYIGRFFIDFLNVLAGKEHKETPGALLAEQLIFNSSKFKLASILTGRLGPLKREENKILAIPENERTIEQAERLKEINEVRNESISLCQVVDVDKYDTDKSNHYKKMEEIINISPSKRTKEQREFLSNYGKNSN